MTAGVGIPQMERLLDDIGLTFDRNFLIDVNTIAQRYATAEGQEANTRLFNRNKKIEKEVNMDEKVSQKILETLIAEIKERTQAREGQEIALIGTDERIIRKKLQGVVAVVIKHEAGNITSFDEAITLVRYARSFYESGGKVEPPAEIMAALVQQLGKIGWDEARIRDELRKAGTPANKLEGEQTGVMTVDPHPTEAADYLQGIDGMEDVVVGQAA
jgi:hypothetical protein